MPIQQVYLIRHGETEWSLSGQHTGTTDIPLTENGRKVARLLEPVLAKQNFALVLTSPLERARQTCELAGLGERACPTGATAAGRTEQRPGEGQRRRDGPGLGGTHERVGVGYAASGQRAPQQLGGVWLVGQRLKGHAGSLPRAPARRSRRRPPGEPPG